MPRRRVVAEPRVGQDHVAGLDEAEIFVALLDLLAGVGDEMVDVALVIGEQDEALEVLGVRAGIVVEALQAVVDTLGREEVQGPGLGPAGTPGAVGDGVVGVAEVGHREEMLDLVQPLRRHLACHRLHDERQRDRAGADAGHDRHSMVAHQDAQLGAVIVAEKARVGERGAVGAGVVQGTVAEAAVEVEVGRLHPHADEGVEGVDHAGRLAAAGESLEGLDQRAGGALVECGHPVHGVVGRLVRGDITHAEGGEDLDQAVGHCCSTLDWPPFIMEHSKLVITVQA